LKKRVNALKQFKIYTLRIAKRFVQKFPTTAPQEVLKCFYSGVRKPFFLAFGTFWKAHRRLREIVQNGQTTYRMQVFNAPASQALSSKTADNGLSAVFGSTSGEKHRPAANGSAEKRKGLSSPRTNL
jgi:hypothetical protein